MARLGSKTLVFWKRSGRDAREAIKERKLERRLKRISKDQIEGSKRKEDQTTSLKKFRRYEGAERCLTIFSEDIEKV